MAMLASLSSRADGDEGMGRGPQKCTAYLTPGGAGPEVWAQGSFCDSTALHMVEGACACGHEGGTATCGAHAAAVPLTCGTCNQQGHLCPVTVTGVTWLEQP